jgi:molybdenum cofactor guanylyltransferase
MVERTPISGIILSGGKSTRMGKNKAFIEIGGIPIIERIHAIFSSLFQEVLIITDEKELFGHLKATIHSDLIPNQGAVAGLYTGLLLASSPYSFCVACDMPFLKKPLIEYLTGQIDGYEAIVPRTKDGLQPLHAIYSKSCLGAIQTIMERKNPKIIDFYPWVKVRFVEEEEFRLLDPTNESFININTPEDLSLIRERKHL